MVRATAIAPEPLAKLAALYDLRQTFGADDEQAGSNPSRADSHFRLGDQPTGTGAALDSSIRGHPTIGLLPPVKIERKSKQDNAKANRRPHWAVPPEVNSHGQPTS